MDNANQQPPSKDLTGAPFPQPRQSFSVKIKTHRTAIILTSVTVLAMLSMGFYIFSPSRNTLVAPLTQNNLPTIAPLVKKTPTVTSKPTVTPTPNPIVINWKTYTNSTYGYNIKYPPDWVSRDLGKLEDKIPSYIAFNAQTASQSARHITISVTTRTYQEQLALGASSSAVTVAGINGTKQSFKDSDGNTSTVIVLPRTGSLLVLRSKTAYLTTFNLMLSTLKITK